MAHRKRLLKKYVMDSESTAETEDCRSPVFTNTGVHVPETSFSDPGVGRENDLNEQIFIKQEPETKNPDSSISTIIISSDSSDSEVDMNVDTMSPVHTSTPVKKNVPPFRGASIYLPSEIFGSESLTTQFTSGDKLSEISSVDISEEELDERLDEHLRTMRESVFHSQQIRKRKFFHQMLKG